VVAGSCVFIVPDRIINEARTNGGCGSGTRAIAQLIFSILDSQFRLYWLYNFKRGID